METGLAGRENGIKFQRRDRMMRSKSFDTQEIREIGRKEAGESRGFPHLMSKNNGRFPSDRRMADGSCKKFSWEEGRTKGRVRLLRARGPVELGKVASGSATQGLWPGDRKVGSQVVGEDRSRFS